MGGSKNTQPAVMTQIQKVELPAWVENASQSNYRLAQQIADKPYQAYEGQTVAGTPQVTKDAWQYILNNGNAGSADYDAARGAAGQAQSLFGKASGGILSLDRDAYTNPYLNDVVGYAMDDLEKSRQLALMGNSDKAVAAKAFGGDRAAVIDAITNSETAQKAGALSASLRSDAYDKANALMQGDINNMISSGQGLLSSGDRYKVLGDTAVSNVNQQYQNMIGVGAQQQAQTQQELNDQYSRWQEKQGYDTERLNLLLASLGMSPYGKTTTGTTTQTGGQTSTGTNWGSLIGGVGSLASGMLGSGGISALLPLLGLSDREDKTDIKKLGDDPVTGVPIYSYRYRDDPKSYPKVVGPMAQDLEKVFPGATREVGGHMIVDGAAIHEMLAAGVPATGQGVAVPQRVAGAPAPAAPGFTLPSTASMQAVKLPAPVKLNMGDGHKNAGLVRTLSGSKVRGVLGHGK